MCWGIGADSQEDLPKQCSIRTIKFVRLSFPLEAIIFLSRLSFFPRGYRFPLEAINFSSRLSFSPRGYHFPLASHVLQVSHGGIYFNRKFVFQKNWKTPSLTAVLLCLPFCLLFSSCKRSATQCWLKVSPREWQSYPRFSPRGFDFPRKETTLIPRHSSRCSYFQCSAAKPEVTCSKGKPWFDWVRWNLCLSHFLQSVIYFLHLIKFISWLLFACFVLFFCFYYFLNFFPLVQLLVRWPWAWLL